MSNAVFNPDLRILNLLTGLAAHNKKRYCYPSQKWLLEKLQSMYGRRISRRSLNRHLSALEAAGYIKRKKRHTRHSSLGYQFRSTLYTISRTTYKMLARLRGAQVFAVDSAAPNPTQGRVPEVAQYDLTEEVIIKYRDEIAQKGGQSHGVAHNVASFLSAARSILA